MVSMSSSRGCHLSTSRTLSHLATRRRRIAGAARLFAHVELEAGDLLDAREDFAHAVAMPIADVRDQRLAAGAQVVERIQVRGGEVFDVDVVAHAGAVGRRVVGAEHRQVRALADRGLAGHLDQQRGGARRLADAALRVGAGHVEIAQHDVAHRRGRAQVAQHPLGHELGGAVGVDRRGRRFFRARPAAGMPYTAAVEENTKCFTPAWDAASSSERVAQVLLP